MTDFSKYEINKVNPDYLSDLTNNKLIIAGPCSFTSYEELHNIAIKLKDMGVKYLRAGSFKPRTSPYSFQGLKDEGLEILRRIKAETGLKIVTELMNISQVEKYLDVVDIIQVGSRNMYNYDFLEDLGKVDKPVLLKRGLSATLEEWLNSAEYIAKNGNHKIILCERGIRGFDNATRNVLDLQSVVLAKIYSKLLVIVDPSHASGRRDLVLPMSKSALACNADGLIIEVHDHPDESKTDSSQTISIDKMKEIMNYVQ